MAVAARTTAAFGAGRTGFGPFAFFFLRGIAQMRLHALLDV
jgi:hypothetical protein